MYACTLTHIVHDAGTPKRTTPPPLYIFVTHISILIHAVFEYFAFDVRAALLPARLLLTCVRTQGKHIFVHKPIPTFVYEEVCSKSVRPAIISPPWVTRCVYLFQMCFFFFAFACQVNALASSGAFSFFTTITRNKRIHRTLCRKFSQNTWLYRFASFRTVPT